MFPGAGASVYRNEAGEVLGWDYPDDGPYDPDDYLPGYENDDMDDEPDVWICDDDGEEFDSLDRYEEHREHSTP
jgi:hypothetical protein